MKLLLSIDGLLWVSACLSFCNKICVTLTLESAFLNIVVRGIYLDTLLNLTSIKILTLLSCTFWSHILRYNVSFIILNTHVRDKCKRWFISGLLLSKHPSVLLFSCIDFFSITHALKFTKLSAIPSPHRTNLFVICRLQTIFLLARSFSVW